MATWEPHPDAGEKLIGGGRNIARQKYGLSAGNLHVDYAFEGGRGPTD